MADELPVSTHTATLSISGVDLIVHVLSDGRRVIEADSMTKLLQAWENGAPVTAEEAMDVARATGATGMTDLLTLSQRVEEAAGPDRRLDGLIWQAIEPDHEYVSFGEASEVLYRRDPQDSVAFDAPPRFTGSLDAAMSLVPEGWNWMAGNRNQPEARAYVENGELAFVGTAARCNPARQWFEVVAATPALALTAAALRARSSQGKDAHAQ